MKAGILGFLSVYLVWIIPSWIFGWKEQIVINGEMIVYLFGDHLILPLFNGASAALLAKTKPKTKLKQMAAAALIGTGVIGVALFFFNPDTISLYRENANDLLELYHVISIFSELSFIVFVLGVFPLAWLRSRVSDVRLHLSSLYFLVFTFVSLVLFTNKLPLWKPTTTLSLIVLAWVITLFHQNILKYVPIKRRSC